MRRHHKVLLVIGVFAMMGMAIPGPWRAASLRANPPAQGTTAVRPAPVGQRLAGNPGQRGATYYALEGQASRVTTRFADAIAVAERTFEGDLTTQLSDLHGNEIARFKVDRIDGVNDVLQYAPLAGKPVQSFSEASVRPTLDWTNHQAYSLWQDRVDSDAVSLEWQNGFMRRRGAPRRDLLKEAVELRTEWVGGLSSRTVHKPIVNPNLLPGVTLRGEVLVTHLTRDGADLGVVNWYPENRVLGWEIPGLTMGYIAAEHLKAYGGWPFTPDMAWLNLQTMAFHQFKTQIQKNGFVASREPGWPERALQFLSPTLKADEPGCDGLHWLDGTVFRYCCDVHDLCYSKNGCTSKSWWQVWSSWRCDYCNVWVVDCFLEAGEWSNIGTVK
jgi:hypothetical protein